MNAIFRALAVGFTLYATLLVGCKGAGSEGSSCIVATGAAPCADGLYCQTNGRMVQKGSEFSYEGTCQARKSVGQNCTADLECSAPLRCASGAPTGTDPTRAMERAYGIGQRSGHCQ
jgi:hypothetical protein